MQYLLHNKKIIFIYLCLFIFIYYKDQTSLYNVVKIVYKNIENINVSYHEHYIKK